MAHACVFRVWLRLRAAAGMIVAAGGCGGVIPVDAPTRDGSTPDGAGPGPMAAPVSPTSRLLDGPAAIADRAGGSRLEGNGPLPSAFSSIVPSNDFQAESFAALAPITSDITIDTGPCSSDKGGLEGGIQTGTSGLEACVVAVEELRIGKGTTVRATGPRPLVFLVRGTVAIEGLLDVGGQGPLPGPGGGAGGMTEQGPGVPGMGPGAGQVCNCTDHADDDCGGGGGGYGAPGAAGGPEAFEACKNGRGKASPGGPAYGAADLLPLTAGSGGGTAGQIPGSPFAGAFGGGGGGALQISSQLEIVVEGAINAGGGGGRFSGELGGDRGGGGGGSGGGILLEAPVIRGAGIVAVNGGGGASGRGKGTTCNLFENGQDGAPSPDPAAGGKADRVCEPGGAGGTGTTPPKPGGKSGNPGAPGGGGGAAGRIRFNWRGHSSTAPVRASGPVSTGELALAR